MALGGYTWCVDVGAKEPSMKKGHSRTTASPRLIPGLISPARLMSPAEALELTEHYPAEVRQAVAGRWVLCGDAGTLLYSKLRDGGQHLAQTMGYVIWHDGESYLVVSHRTAESLHRFMLPLHCVTTQAFLESCRTRAPLISLGNAGGDDAILFMPQLPVEALVAALDAGQQLVEEERAALAGTALGLLDYQAFTAPTDDPHLQEIAVSVWLPPIPSHKSRTPH